MAQRLINCRLIISCFLLLILSSNFVAVYSNEIVNSNLNTNVIQQVMEISIKPDEIKNVIVENYFSQDVVGFVIEIFENSSYMEKGWLNYALISKIDIKPLHIDYIKGDSRLLYSFVSFSDLKFFLKDVNDSMDLELELDPIQSESLNFVMRIVNIKTVSLGSSGATNRVGFVSGQTHYCCQDYGSEGFLGSEANVTIYIRKYVEQQIKISFYHLIIRPEQDQTSIDYLLNITLDDYDFHQISIVLPPPSDYDPSENYNWFSELFVSVESNDSNLSDLGIYGVVQYYGNSNPKWEDISLSLLWLTLPLIIIPVLRKRNIRK